MDTTDKTLEKGFMNRRRGDRIYLYMNGNMSSHRVDYMRLDLGTVLE
jgi:hypothetical protein